MKHGLVGCGLGPALPHPAGTHCRWRQASRPPNTPVRTRAPPAPRRRRRCWTRSTAPSAALRRAARCAPRSTSSSRSWRPKTPTPRRQRCRARARVAAHRVGPRGRLSRALRCTLAQLHAGAVRRRCPPAGTNLAPCHCLHQDTRSTLSHPLQMMSALNGEWKLVYTSNSELLAILALSKLPLVTVGDITQRVDAVASTVENKARPWGGGQVGAPACGTCRDAPVCGRASAAWQWLCWTRRGRRPIAGLRHRLHRPHSLHRPSPTRTLPPLPPPGPAQRPAQQHLTQRDRGLRGAQPQAHRGAL